MATVTTAHLQRAALEYSGYRPLFEFDDWEPDPGFTVYPLPTNVIGVRSITYGENVPYNELLLAGEDQALLGWHTDSRFIYIHPAPVAGTIIPVVWLKAHQYNSGSNSFPTIPTADQDRVRDLALAFALEEDLRALLKGPLSYTFGQTQVNRAGVIKPLQDEIARIKAEFSTAFSEPISAWG